jgi:glyoxylase-like metal-dependent hydrolase (beta-lactamase superfamily II)
MKMHLLPGGRLRMRKNIFLPDADRSETIELPVSCALLRHPQGNVLFDTGCHPSVPDDAPGRWGGLAKLMTPIMSRGDNVVDGLGALGLGCNDIDVVICSHLHPDHCGCNAFFKRATVIIHRKELEAARAPGAENAGYIAAEWAESGPVSELEGERDLFGDGRIVLLPFPGHTPGSIGALVVLEQSGQFLLAADTVSLSASIERNVLPRNIWNADALSKSLAEIKHIQKQGTTVLCGHDDAQWQTLRKGADAYA